MSTTSKENSDVTFIEVIKIEPENQDQLIELLVCLTEKVMKNVPGFISATFHKSIDGTRIANYSKWKSREHFEAMLRDPKIIAQFSEIIGFPKYGFEFGLYDVVNTIK